MTNEGAPPWPSLVANLDVDTSRDTASEIINLALSETEALRERVLTLMPLIVNLRTVAGRMQGLSILLNHIGAVPELRDLFVELTHDEDAKFRRLGATALTRCADYPPARVRLYELVEDESPELREIGMRAFLQLASTQPKQDSPYALRVIPEPSVNAEALELLEQLERALHTIQDLSPDDAQDRILEKIVFPAIARLRDLLGGTAENVDSVQANRRDSVLQVGTLSGGARAVLHGAPATVTLLANGDEAAKTVESSLRGVYNLGEMILSLLSNPM